MIETTLNIDKTLYQNKTFRMGTNPRTAGSIPIWDNVNTAKQASIQTLENASTQENKQLRGLSFNETQINDSKNKEFTFLDIIDMVNPLHHIPIVNNIYRNVTGDEIKPISKIIGGGVYTGAIGAATSLVDVIIEKETGKDITSNIKDLVLKQEIPSLNNKRKTSEAALNQASRDISNIKNLGSALSFVDMQKNNDIHQKKSAHEYNSRYNN